MKSFENYLKITRELSLYLISQYERNGIVEDPKRLSLISYQLMNEDIFNQFVNLFKKTSSGISTLQFEISVLMLTNLSIRKLKFRLCKVTRYEGQERKKPHTAAEECIKHP